MTDAVRAAYDAVAEQYAALFLGDLDRDANGRDWLAAFAALAAPGSGAIADLGCGPGHVVHHLCGLGSSSADAHGTPFDHAVVTAYELFPATIARHLSDAGFTDVAVGVYDPPNGARPLDQGTVLARKRREF